MQKLKKKLTTLLPILLVTCNLACKKLPKKPEGELCLHNQPKAVAQCAKLNSGEVLPAKPISETHKFIMFSPETWENVSNYIDKLIYELRKNGYSKVQTDDGASLNLDHVEKEKDYYFKTLPDYLQRLP